MMIRVKCDKCRKPVKVAWLMYEQSTDGIWKVLHICKKCFEEANRIEVQ